MTIVRISQGLLGSLLAKAEETPRRRLHHNLHLSYTDACQRLLNAIGPDSYIRPHRHAIDPKTESLVAVRGKFALITFDDGGTPERVIRFGTELHGRDSQLDAGVEVPAAKWHTVIALVPASVLLEVKSGPFNTEAAKELAPWAPEEESAGASEYFQALRRIAEP